MTMGRYQYKVVTATTMRSFFYPIAVRRSGRGGYGGLRTTPLKHLEKSNIKIEYDEIADP